MKLTSILLSYLSQTAHLIQQQQQPLRQRTQSLISASTNYILSRQASVLTGLLHGSPPPPSSQQKSFSSGAEGAVEGQEEKQGKEGRMSSHGPQEPKSVLQEALQLFSTKPMTGYYRDGYCRVGNEDPGNHSVAGVVTESFLDYSASKGNNLRDIGLTGGCKWCLCSTRWQEALDAFRAGKIGRDAVPKVHLDATHDAALRDLKLDDLKEFSA